MYNSKVKPSPLDDDTEKYSWSRIESLNYASYTHEPCPGLVDYVMVWIKEPFIKNEKSTLDVLISWVTNPGHK